MRAMRPHAIYTRPLSVIKKEKKTINAKFKISRRNK